MNATSSFSSIATHDLSFTTSFNVASLFLKVKASCPTTYQFLTVQMVEPIDENGIINQTIFKTKENYGFDLLIFPNDVLTLIKNYINFIRPRLNPCCDLPNWKVDFEIKQHLSESSFFSNWKYIKPDTIAADYRNRKCWKTYDWHCWKLKAFQ